MWTPRLTLRSTRLAMVLATTAFAPTAIPLQAMAPTPAAQPAAGTVEPEAVAALKRMSTFLGSLTSFALTATATHDVVTQDGQRVQMDSVAAYKVKRPGFVVDVQNDLKPRKYVYDGKQFTVFSPKLGFYASMPAPATNREMLDVLHDDYAVNIPLEDLFRWHEPGGLKVEKLTSGYHLGTATIDGAVTDHYVFRQPEIDWEIWIEQGERPIPRKIAIVDRTDPALPGQVARLNWTLNTPFDASEFAFVPAADAKRISIAALQAARSGRADANEE